MNKLQNNKRENRNSPNWCIKQRQCHALVIVSCVLLYVWVGQGVTWVYMLYFVLGLY
jgi:hypothetical protein